MRELHETVFARRHIEIQVAEQAQRVVRLEAGERDDRVVTGLREANRVENVRRLAGARQGDNDVMRVQSEQFELLQ